MAMAIPMSRLSFRGMPLRHHQGGLLLQTAKKPTTIRSNSNINGAGVRRTMAAMVREEEPSLVTRPLAEILRDMNKRVPDQVLKTRNDNGVILKYIPWYHANRMLSFYAPGWSGEVRSIVFSEDGSTVSVVYRVTIRGSDGECFRESSGTAAVEDTSFGDPVQKAEGMAFRRACARFGLGLYLYHEDEFPLNIVH